MSLANAANQQRVKLLEDQLAQGKQVSLKLSETNDKLAQTTSERVALEQKSEGLRKQLDQSSQIAEKNERLNQKIGFLQRDLEAAEKSNRDLQQRLEDGTSGNESGSVGSDKLERILSQLQSQNRQISELVAENKNMAAKLASRPTASRKASRSSGTTKRKKAKVGGKDRDDLTEIVGIGPTFQGKLHRAGVKTYRQIADWTKEDIEKYSKKLGFKSSSRIDQEKWVSQAKKLA